MSDRPKKIRPTDEEIAQALIRNQGLFSYAANEIDCNRTTISRRIDRSEYLQGVLKDITETTCDLAENGLNKALCDGEAYAICFYLKTKGRNRGFVQRQEVSGPDQGPIKIDLSDEDLQKIIDKE